MLIPCKSGFAMQFACENRAVDKCGMLYCGRWSLTVQFFCSLGVNNKKIRAVESSETLLTLSFRSF